MVPCLTDGAYRHRASPTLRRLQFLVIPYKHCRPILKITLRGHCSDAYLSALGVIFIALRHLVYSQIARIAVEVYVLLLFIYRLNLIIYVALFALLML